MGLPGTPFASEVAGPRTRAPCWSAHPATIKRGTSPVPATLHEPQAPPPPNFSPVLIMTAIAHQDKWILSQGRLESVGFSFVHSLRGRHCMATPYSTRLQLGRDRENMPILHGRFAAEGPFAECPPGTLDDSDVGILVDTGATIHVAGAFWATRLSLLPGVGISDRTVRGGVSASLGRGTA